MEHTLYATHIVGNTHSSVDSMEHTLYATHIVGNTHSSVDSMQHTLYATHIVGNTHCRQHTLYATHIVGDGQYDEWQCFVSREEEVEEVPFENVRYIGCVTKP